MPYLSINKPCDCCECDNCGKQMWYSDVVLLDFENRWYWFTPEETDETVFYCETCKPQNVD